MKIKTLFFIILLTVLLQAPSAYSASLEGTVVSISPGLLIINVGGDDRLAILRLEHATELRFFDTLENLNYGDWVSIHYWHKDGHFFAGAIIKEATGPDEF